MITSDAPTTAQDDAPSAAQAPGSRGSLPGATPEPHDEGDQKPGPVSPVRKGKTWTLSPLAIAFVTSNAVLLAMAVYAIVSLGSIRAAVGYYMRGETLFFDAREKTFGTAVPGETVPVSFEMTNRGADPIRVLGCRAGCSCMVPRDLPYTLRPNERKTLNLTVRMPPRRDEARPPAKLGLPLTLFTSNRAQSRIELLVRGDLRDRPGGVP